MNTKIEEGEEFGSTPVIIPDPEKIVVTRHPGLVEFLVSRGVVGADVQVIEHATADQVRGKHVFGVLPLHLAREAACVTEIPLNIPQELRGKELSVEQVRQFAGEPWTYAVHGEVGVVPPTPTLTLEQAKNLLRYYSISL